jgi:hypothetical protein
MFTESVTSELNDYSKPRIKTKVYLFKKQIHRFDPKLLINTCELKQFDHK